MLGKRALLVRAGFCASALVVGFVALELARHPDSTIRELEGIGYVAGLAAVLGSPLFVYLVAVRSRVGSVVDGCIATASFAVGWSAAARSTSSTPVMGLFLPSLGVLLVVIVTIVVEFARNQRQYRGSEPARSGSKP